MLVTPSGIVIEVRLEQPLKASFKKEVAQPNSILYPPPIGPAVFNLKQLLKTLFPIEVTLLGIVIEVRLVQLLKAQFPMLVTPSGIVIEVRLEQLLKTPFPMLVTFLKYLNPSKDLMLLL